MKFRKLLVSAVAIAAIASTTLLQAQEEKKRGSGGGRGMMTPEQRIEQLETAVGKLSEEQKKKITAIYAKSAEKMRAAGQDGGREKMMEIMQEARKDVRATLTPEQQKKFDDMPQGGRGQGGGKKQN